MSQNRVALCQDLAIELDDGDIGCRVHLCNTSFLVLGVFLKAVPGVVVGYSGIFPKQANDLAAAAGLEVEVVDVRNSSDGFIASRFGETSCRRRHFDEGEMI